MIPVTQMVFIYANESIFNKYYGFKNNYYLES